MYNKRRNPHILDSNPLKALITKGVCVMKNLRPEIGTPSEHEYEGRRSLNKNVYQK
jgi:hypothetical protein